MKLNCVVSKGNNNLDKHKIFDIKFLTKSMIKLLIVI